MEKICSTCKVSKDVSEFYKNSRCRDGYANGCKQCTDACSTRWRQANGDKHECAKARRYAATKQLVVEYKSSRGCIVCGVTEPVCLDMHHLDPSQKETDPSNLIHCSYSRWLKEAEKCVVVCKNCHAMVHAGIITLNIGEPG